MELFNKMGKGCVMATFALLITSSFAEQQLSYSEVTCQQILANPEILWSERIDLGSGYVAPTHVDYSCQRTTSIRQLLSELINMAQPHGVDQCSGSSRYALNRMYNFQILQMDIDPRGYLQKNTLQEQLAWREKNNPSLKTYYTAWAVLSPSNYPRYQQVQVKLKEAKPLLIDYYKTNTDLTKLEINELVDTIITFFLYHAGGHTSSDETIKMSSLAYLLFEDQPSVAQLKAMLSKASQQDIDQALKTALLTNKSEQIINLLIDHLVEVDQGDESALFFTLNNKDYTEKLLKKGADVNYQNSFAKTPLFYAIANSNHKMVKLLIEKGANVNQQYKIISGDRCASYNTVNVTEGRTPLMHAAQHSDLAMLKILVAAGADINLKDAQGWNALDYSQSPSYIRNNDEATSAQNIAYLQALGLSAIDTKTKL